MLVIMVVGAAIVALFLYYKDNETDNTNTEKNESVVNETENAIIEDVLNHILKNEGGYVNDKDDAGGETNFGISKRAHPNEDIKNMTAERAKEIYKSEYVEPMRQYWVGKDKNNIYQIIDSAVNAGVSKTKQLLQKVTSSLSFKQVRKDFYISIAKGAKAKFLNGWLKRINVEL